jgi:serine/threonine-protein kinase
VKVVDFGIAKAMNSSHETRAGMLKGKIGYMAPEQARGERVDRRADIFSVGVMLWEAAVGRRLWKGMNEVQILHQLLSGEIPRPRSMRADISDHLEHIILRSLAPNRDERYASCTELQIALEELMDSGGERGALREVGRVVTQAFEEERRKLKTIIEQQLAKSNMLATGMYQQMPLPALDPQTQFTGEHPAHGRGSVLPASSSLPQLGAAMAHTGSGPSVSQISSYGAAGAPGVYPGAQAGAAFTASGASSIPSFHTVPVSGSYPGGQHQSSPSVSSQPSAPTGSIARANLSRAGMQDGGYASSSDSSKRVTFVVLGVAAVAGVLAALLYVGVRGKEPAPAATSSAAPAEPLATAPQPDLRPRELKLEIVVKPADATIYLDDEKLDGNPYRATLSRDDKEHQLRVEAPGRETRTRTIRADETSVTWEVELPLVDAQAASASSVPSSAPQVVPYRPVPRPPPTPKDPTPAPEPRPSGKRPTRPIDPTYPGG